MENPKVQNLAKKKCVPCEGGLLPFTRNQAEAYLAGLSNWTLGEDAKRIQAEYVMKNFMAGIKLMQAIAEIAEQEGHHPDFHLTGYRKLMIELSTHAIGGLSENDFILAAKIEALAKELKSPQQ